MNLAKPISFAKLVCSALVIAATLGLLGHHSVSVSQLWPAQAPAASGLPGWILSAANGWYTPVLEQAAILFQRSKVSFCVYLLAQSLVVAAMFAVPFLAVAAVRYFLSLLLLAGMAYDLSLYAIAGELPNYDTTATMLGNLHVGFRGVLGTYASIALPSVAAVFAVAVVFCWKPVESAGRLAASVVAMGFLAVGSVVWWTSGHTTAFPSPISSYINFFKAIADGGDQDLQPVSYTGNIHSPFANVVLIVDESVRGDYISLNNPDIGTTPFLLSQARTIENFGLASSGANCSTQARLILRFGARPDDLSLPWKAIRSKSALWQFAKHAGFETVHLDAQGTATRYDSGMTATEASHVERRIVVDTYPPYDRDDIVASTLRDLIQRPGRKFILVDKYGVHVPYDKAYPPGYGPFNSLRSEFSLKDKAAVVAHYRNAINWSVDRFFEKLLLQGLPPNTLLVYTSDHGQVFSESGAGMSHCNAGPAVSRDEAIVPLFTLTSDFDWKERLSYGATVNFDRTSHFQLFPSILQALGYEEAWVRHSFGPSIIDTQGNPNGRLFWAGGAIVRFDTGQ